MGVGEALVRYRRQVPVAGRAADAVLLSLCRHQTVGGQLQELLPSGFRRGAE